MRRPDERKLQIFEVRHPGLYEKVVSMFNSYALLKDVQEMIRTQYGERLTLRSVERYKSKHWRAQRDRIQEMSKLIGSSGHLAIGTR